MYSKTKTKAKLLDTDNRLVVVRDKEWGVSERGAGDKRHELPVIKMKPMRDIMHSMVILVNNTLLHIRKLLRIDLQKVLIMKKGVKKLPRICKKNGLIKLHFSVSTIINSCLPYFINTLMLDYLKRKISDIIPSSVNIQHFFK